MYCIKKNKIVEGSKMCIAKFSKDSFEAEIIDSREDREILDQQCQELNKDLLEADTKLNESEATTNDDKSGTFLPDLTCSSRNSKAWRQ
nr:uncharacterized protein LOC26530914 isoform X10 [Drosophila virilis]